MGFFFKLMCIHTCNSFFNLLCQINALDQDGRTALHHACSLQRVHLVCLLLRRQANQEIRDKDGRRPIDVAIDTAHADIVTLLRLQPLHSDSKVSSVSSIIVTELEEDFLTSHSMIAPLEFSFCLFQTPKSWYAESKFVV